MSLIYLGEYLSTENTGTSDLFDLLFSCFAEEPRLYNDGLLGQGSFTEDFVETVPYNIDDGGFAFLVGLVLFTHLVADQSPQLVHVESWTVVFQGVSSGMEISHADLSEVTRMVFVEVDSVMMLTTGITTTTWMFPGLA